MSKRLVLVFVVLACAAAIFAAGQQVGAAGSEFGILRVGWAGPEAGAPEQAQAQDAMPLGRTPAAIVDGQYPASYFPNTELLGAAEIRITALGTGMPNQTKRAVSISYYVELGNGEKFIFDIGSGAMGNLFSLRPDFSKIDKVFASHLHVDHVGDFMGLHIGSWLSGRYTPLHIYGPSGASPELGTKAYVDAIQQAYAWDIATRTGALPDACGQIEVHEFAYMQENVVVYQENGVTIRSCAQPKCPSRFYKWQNRPIDNIFPFHLQIQKYVHVAYFHQTIFHIAL